MWIVLDLTCSGCHSPTESVVKFVTFHKLTCILDYEKQGGGVKHMSPWSLPAPSFCTNPSSVFDWWLPRDLLVRLWQKPHNVFREATHTALLAEVQSPSLLQLHSRPAVPFSPRFAQLLWCKMTIWQTVRQYKRMTGDHAARDDGLLLERSACSPSNLLSHLREELYECSNLKAMSSWNIFQLDLSHHFCSSWHAQWRIQ